MHTYRHFSFFYVYPVYYYWWQFWLVIESPIDISLVLDDSLAERMARFSTIRISTLPLFGCFIWSIFLCKCHITPKKAKPVKKLPSSVKKCVVFFAVISKSAHRPGTLKKNYPYPHKVETSLSIFKYVNNYLENDILVLHTYLLIHGFNYCNRHN